MCQMLPAMMIVSMQKSRKTALVLSGGGTFGAYQAGVWTGISEYFQPDLVVGASVGSLNGWAIAGGCSPAELTRRWREIDTSGAERLRLPKSPIDGLMGSDFIEEWTRD